MIQFLKSFQKTFKKKVKLCTNNCIISKIKILALLTLLGCGKFFSGTCFVWLLRVFDNFEVVTEEYSDEGLRRLSLHKSKNGTRTYYLKHTPHPK